VLQQQYNNKIVQPWLESLSKEGEGSLLGAIKLCSDGVRSTLDSALEKEQLRFDRELKAKEQPPEDATVDNLVTSFVNLVAAEEALLGLKRAVGQK